MDIAGWPVTLQMGVKGIKAAARIRPWSGFSGVEAAKGKGQLGQGGREPDIAVHEEPSDVTAQSLEALDAQDVI
jgi:hypothetical protein